MDDNQDNLNNNLDDQDNNKDNNQDINLEIKLSTKNKGGKDANEGHFFVQLSLVTSLVFENLE